METHYKIIGGDGREYGPVTLDELKSWIRDGRVSGTTHVWRSDANAWSAAANYQELQTEFGAVPGAAMRTNESDLAPAGFWARLGAYIIDGIVLSVIMLVIWNVVLKALGWQEPAQPDIKPTSDMMVVIHAVADYVKANLTFYLTQMFAGFLVQMLYEVSLNGRFGATLGKMVIGAKIVRLDGSPLGFGVAFLRFLAERLSGLTCCIGYLFIAFREDKRALHDLIVGTKVVFKR